MLSSPRAEADTRHYVAINYDIDQALQACPNLAEFRAILALQLGYDPYRTGSSSGVWVRVRPTENGIEGTIDWSTPSEEHVGERRFASRSEDCQKLLATVGFVVAVQIQLMEAEKEPKNSLDSDVTTSGDSPSGAHLGTREIQYVPSLTLTLRSFDVRRSASHVAKNRVIMVGVGPAVGLGLAPEPVGVGRLFGAARLDWFGLEVGVERSLPSTTTQSYGGGFKHVLTLGTLGACGWYENASACALTKLGRIHVTGFGIDRTESPAGFIAQLGPRIAYALQLGNHVLLLGRVETLYLLTPWTVDLNHVAVWNMPRWSAVAGIDLATSFP